MKEEKRIDFLGFETLEDDWFNKEDNSYYNILNKKYHVIIDTKNPDYLFLGPFLFKNIYAQEKFIKSKIRIFITVEAVVPDFNCVDYAISYFDNIKIEDRCLKLLDPSISKLIHSSCPKKKEAAKILEEKSKFCNYIYTHKGQNERKNIFKTLNKYKRVDSLGKYLNNTKIENEMKRNGDWLKSSIELKKPYKFSIAFENSHHFGYLTEKISTSFLANTIPIYWGDPIVDRYINSKAFINCFDFNSFEDVAKRVQEIDENDDLYINILSQNRLTELGQKEVEESDSKLEKFLYHIFDQDIYKARKRGRGLWNSMNEKFMINVMKENRWTEYGVISGKEKLRITIIEFCKKIGVYQIFTTPIKLVKYIKKLLLF